MKSCCLYVAERIERYHDGELPADEVQVVRQNLQSCSDCRALLAGLERLDAVGQHTFFPEPDTAYWEDLTARITSAIAPVTSKEPLWERFRVAAVSAVDMLAIPRPALGFAAAAAVLLLVIQVSFHPFSNPFTSPAGNMAGMPEITEIEGSGDTGVTTASQPDRPEQAVETQQSANGVSEQSAAPRRDESYSSEAGTESQSSLATLERINPLREQSRKDPISSGAGNTDKTSTIADLLEEPDTDNQRLKRESGLLSEGGVPQAEENASTFTLQSGRSDQRNYFTGQFGDREQTTDLAENAESDISRLTTDELVTRRDQLLTALNAEEDPLVRNITIKHLDDIFVALLKTENAEQYHGEARNFYVTYKDSLTALLGAQQYQSRFALLDR